MRTLNIMEIDLVAGGVRRSISAHPVTTSVHHGKAHKLAHSSHHARLRTSTLHGTATAKVQQTLDEGDDPPISEGGGGEGDGDGDGGGDGDGDGDGYGGDGYTGGDGGGAEELATIDVTATATGGALEGTVSNPELLDTITVYATSEQVAAAAAQNALPGECSIGTLLGNVSAGAVTGFVFGIGTGPGALASAIAGGALAAFGTSVGCAWAIHANGLNP